MMQMIGVCDDFKRPAPCRFSAVQGMNESDPRGTPEVHGKMDLNKYLYRQSVRLVGAVGIEN
jgi:hypothetical protein